MPTELWLGWDFAARRGLRKAQRAENELGRQRPYKQGAHVGNSRSRELAFGKSRSTKKSSKSEIVTQDLCNFRTTENCWPENKTKIHP